jgi:hypothetical protein
MRLSETQIFFLTDHVEENTIRPYGSNKNEDATRNSLLALKLIRETRDGTITTPAGRDAKCLALARWADALDRAGFQSGRYKVFSRLPMPSVGFSELKPETEADQS